MPCTGQISAPGAYSHCPARRRRKSIRGITSRCWNPGRGLRVTARAADGVVEAVEWEDKSNWVVGVQWHPERMPADALAQTLFRELVTAAKLARAEK